MIWERIAGLLVVAFGLYVIDRDNSKEEKRMFGNMLYWREV